MKLLYSAEAKKDLNGIFEYIAQDNPSKAIEFNNYIKKEIVKLIAFPLLGVSEELPDKIKNKLPNSRKYILKNYIAHYTIFEQKQILYITKIHNAAMQNYRLI